MLLLWASQHYNEEVVVHRDMIHKTGHLQSDEAKLSGQWMCVPHGQEPATVGPEIYKAATNRKRNLVPFNNQLGIINE